jgi:hypothetical protein
MHGEGAWLLASAKDQGVACGANKWADGRAGGGEQRREGVVCEDGEVWHVASVLSTCARGGGTNNINVNNLCSLKGKGARVVACGAREWAGQQTVVNGGGAWLLASPMGSEE